MIELQTSQIDISKIKYFVFAIQMKVHFFELLSRNVDRAMIDTSTSAYPRIKYPIDIMGDVKLFPSTPGQRQGFLQFIIPPEMEGFGFRTGCNYTIDNDTLILHTFSKNRRNYV